MFKWVSYLLVFLILLFINCGNNNCYSEVLLKEFKSSHNIKVIRNSVEYDQDFIEVKLLLGIGLNELDSFISNNNFISYESSEPNSIYKSFYHKIPSYFNIEHFTEIEKTLYIQGNLTDKPCGFENATYECILDKESGKIYCLLDDHYGI